MNPQTIVMSKLHIEKHIKAYAYYDDVLVYVNRKISLQQTIRMNERNNEIKKRVVHNHKNNENHESLGRDIISLCVRLFVCFGHRV